MEKSQFNGSAPQPTGATINGKLIREMTDEELQQTHAGIIQSMQGEDAAFTAAIQRRMAHHAALGVISFEMERRANTLAMASRLPS